MQSSKTKRIFDFNDLTKMFETNILSDRECVELVEGEILERNETVREENIKSQKIADALKSEFGERADVKTKPLVKIYETQCLRPSIAVTKPLTSDENNSIRTKDTFFVIELTKLKFNYEDNPRSRYYGLFNYPEVWFVNTDLGLIEVCTKPNYGFSQCRTYLRNAVLKSETYPDFSIDSTAILNLEF